MTLSSQWQNFEYTSSDGLGLAGRKYGWQHVDRLPVVCLAGLTRNSADFHELASHLSTHEKTPRRVLCLDYRGRGKSEYDKNWDNYNPLTEASDTLDGIVAAGLEHVAIIGTSRGGMIAMALAAMRPGVMKAVVLNDVGPEIDGQALVRVKNYIENASDPKNWDEAVEVIKTISAKQFPKWDKAELERQARLIFEEEDGKIIRQYDPRIAKTLAAINLDLPLPTFWPQFEGLSSLPVLLIRGDNSDLLSPHIVEKMQQVHQTLELIKVPDQGHAPDLGGGQLPQAIAKFVAAAERMIA